MFCRSVLVHSRRAVAEQQLRRNWLGAVPAGFGWQTARSGDAVGRHVRSKYTQHSGVKGIRNKKTMYESQAIARDDVDCEEGVAEALNLDDRDYDEVVNSTMHVTRDAKVAQNVLIIQPYVKWGPKRDTQTPPDDKLQEAEALVRSLPNWSVAHSIKVSLETLERKTLFGTGKMAEIKQIVQQLREQSTMQKPLTCIFVSKGSLTFAQKRNLEAEFHLPVMDRYSVVVQILRLHATSAEARIQVAMAEIPYIWAQAKDANISAARKQGYSLTDTQREILKTRERKLKQELERIRSHRKLLRNRRKLKNYPIVAVVGYTNAGKTSLIKALTDEQTMQPRDQLFATLDVTAHAGMLPSNLEVIYMDTVGFMSDLPTGLLECFVATLEDAMLADVIVHVHDLSHNCHQAQRQHVEATLRTLAQNIAHSDEPAAQQSMPPVINVGNKIDLLEHVSPQPDVKFVSSKELTGLHELLLEIERSILVATGRRKMTIRVRNGGDEMAWLYKNAAVVNLDADADNPEQLLMRVVITESALVLFKRSFCT